MLRDFFAFVYRDDGSFFLSGDVCTKREATTGGRRRRAGDDEASDGDDASDGDGDGDANRP